MITTDPTTDPHNTCGMSDKEWLDEEIAGLRFLLERAGWRDEDAQIAERVWVVMATANGGKRVLGSYILRRIEADDLRIGAVVDRLVEEGLLTEDNDFYSFTNEEVL